MQKETILNVFPSTDDLNRLVVAVQQEDGDTSSRLVLRQETFAEDVGWFVQSCVAIEPEQVAGLKMALSGPESPSGRGSKRRQGERNDVSLSRVPAILSFHGVLAGNAG